MSSIGTGAMTLSVEDYQERGKGVFLFIHSFMHAIAAVTVHGWRCPLFSHDGRF